MAGRVERCKGDVVDRVEGEAGVVGEGRKRGRRQEAMGREREV